MHPEHGVTFLWRADASKLQQTMHEYLRWRVSHGAGQIKGIKGAKKAEKQTVQSGSRMAILLNLLSQDKPMTTLSVRHE